MRYIFSVGLPKKFDIGSYSRYPIWKILIRCKSDIRYLEPQSRKARSMGRKAGGLYINPKKFGAVSKPCMREMVTFLGCLSLNKNNENRCIRQKDLLVSCLESQRGKPKNAARTINYHLQRLGREKFL